MKTKEEILTMDLRDVLKRIMEKEISQLQTTLESLPAKERINIVCKLMPYIFPKVDTISSSSGEPFTFEY